MPRTTGLKKLNEKHETYCLLRVAGETRLAAYRGAGFGGKGNETTTRKDASNFDRDPLIQARMAELWQEKLKSLHMDVDEILARVAMIARADVRALYDENGNLLPPGDLDVMAAAGIAGIETVEEFEGTGKDRVKVGDVRKVRLRDPMPALRLLAEHKKLVKAPEEGLNALAGAIADRLKAARERKRKEPAK